MCAPRTSRSSSSRLGHSAMGVTINARTTQRLGSGKWRPVSITVPVLLSFISVSLGLAAVIEYLAQKSQREGGLCLLPDADQPSTGITLSRYLPTVIAVIYSMTWTWIDLDIRRIQPWLELSRVEGGTADSSLLLDYPFEFLAFVPLKAWRRKHWLVFLAGTIMMLIFWAITPLQGAVFGTQSVTVAKESTATDTAQLGTLERQLDMLDSSILNMAYGITWLKQAYPAFTTSTHAFLPFQPAKNNATIQPEETWSASTIALGTDLQCWPATITNLTNTERKFNFGDYMFDNGQGCQATLTPPATGTTANVSGVLHTVLYVPWYNDPTLDFFLANPNCTEAAMHQFLAIWQAQDTKAMTAVFCEPSYHKQKVMVTVAARDKRPDEGSMVPLGNLEALTDEEFNSTAFEYLIGTGVTPKRMRRDYPRDRVLEQYPTLVDMKIAWPITNMVGFALGGMNYTLAELANATALMDIFKAAHQKLFSAAISALLQPGDLPSTTRSATVRYTLYGVVVSRPISIAVQVLLLITASLASIVLVMSSRPQIMLDSDPGRRGTTVAILGTSGDLLKEFAYKDRYDQATLEKSVSGRRYRMVRSAGAEGGRLRIESLLPAAYVDPQLDPDDARCGATRHSALSPCSGVVFIFILLAGMGVTLYLKHQEEALGGLPRPSNSFEVLQLLENYIPTVFATLLEPFLVLLNRLLCLLQPFHDLQEGSQPARKAFETSYTSLPPQFALWDSLKSGHLLLGSLCLITLLANVLAVALGAVFNESPVFVNHENSFNQVYSSSMNDTAFHRQVNTPVSLDHFYVVMTNLSSETPLPPWSDAGFAYVPFTTQPSSNRGISSSIYRAVTRGIGVNVTCSPLSTTPYSAPYVNYTIGDDGSQDIQVVVKTVNGTAKCRTRQGLETSSFLDTSAPHTPGYIAQEMVTYLQRAFETINGTRYDIDDGGACSGKLVMSWMRLDPTCRKETFTATHLYCVPRWQSAAFDVTVDSEGYVLKSSRIGDFDDDQGLDADTQNRTQNVVSDINYMIGGPAAIGTNFMQAYGGEEGWHNDTLTEDWMNYLLKLALNSTRLIDPAQSVPTPDSTLTAPVESLYRMLSANIIATHMLSLFSPLVEPVQLEGLETVLETRIFMDRLAFVAIVAILGIMVIVATMLYIRERKPLLPRLPSTIGSLLAYVAASRGVREYAKHSQVRQANRYEKDVVDTYSYGLYTGVDGGEHLGIELDPFVKRIR